MEFHLPLLKGCATSASLIIAIGAQNAFVIKQGLMRNQLFITALFCSLVDSTLILIGIGGMGQLMTTNEILMFVAKWGGVLFLVWYGFKSFRSTFSTQSMNVGGVDARNIPSLKETILTLAVVCFLNPHVYLDTVLLIGSIGSQFPLVERQFFALGAIVTSFAWFFSVSYGAQFFSPIFQNPKAWKILDFVIGCMMWSIALSLIFYTPEYC